MIPGVRFLRRWMEFSRCFVRHISLVAVNSVPRNKGSYPEFLPGRLPKAPRAISAGGCRHQTLPVLICLLAEKRSIVHIKFIQKIPGLTFCDSYDSYTISFLLSTFRLSETFFSHCLLMVAHGPSSTFVT